jgi:hypothetical protein
MSRAHWDYIDLKPGWRLRVITPVLKSGDYLPGLTGGQLSGNTITLEAGEQFEGYETALYAVEPHEEGGVRIKFVAAELTTAAGTAAQPSPRLRLFHLSPRERFVRLIYFNTTVREMAFGFPVTI